MEIGVPLHLPKEVRVKKQDLQTNMSIGVIVNSQFGSLIRLREALAKLFPKGFVYCTITGEPLYLVHFNDLSEEKQKKLGGWKR